MLMYIGKCKATYHCSMVDEERLELNEHSDISQPEENPNDGDTAAGNNKDVTLCYNLLRASSSTVLIITSSAIFATKDGLSLF